MAIDIKMTDHSDEVLAALKEQAEAALEAIGNQAVSHAKQNISKAGRIDTSALINSIDHQVDEDTCYIGTNNEYAIYNEYGTGIHTDGGGGRQTPWSFQDRKGEWHRTRGMTPVHFLKNAVADHISEYKAIIKQILQGK